MNFLKKHLKTIPKVFMFFPLSVRYMFKYKKVYYNDDLSETEKSNELSRLKQEYSTIFLKRSNIKVKINGGIPKDNKNLFVINHRSLLDIIVIENVLNQMNKDGVWIAKSSLLKVLVLGNYFKYSGCVPVDLKDKTKLKSFFKNVKYKVDNIKDCNILIFPEGTRSKKDGINEFQGGASFIAKQNKLKVIPIYIDAKLEEDFINSPYITKTKNINVYIGKEIDYKNMELEYKEFLKENNLLN